MKRLWLGIGLLLGLIVVGVLTTHVMDRIHRPIGETLGQADQAARAEDWDRAADLSRQARARWVKYRAISASVTDHTPMEQIDALFGELEIYAQQEEWVHFRACCAELIAWTEAVAEAQNVTWWSIL